MGRDLLQEHYEILRGLAVESNNSEPLVSDCFELAFIERQGLAACVEARLAGSLPADFQDVEVRAAASGPDGLVLALVDLVVGNRAEVKND